MKTIQTKALPSQNNMTDKILETLTKLVQTPNLASKRWIYEQYDSQVMNDTIDITGDAAVVRVHGTNKALATTSDCTPRYVEADPYLGGMQAVAETYRNISAVGARPMAITNCLNFGNPEKPEIMGQIVKAIKGINSACEALNYPVISGNVSLYNETNGKAIQPTPTIGGVGLLKDLNLRCNSKFKNIDDIILVIGRTAGHLDCSIFQRDILGIDKKSNPPKVDLEAERNNSQFVRELINNKVVNSCHDISDGGLLVAIFEMCNKNFGAQINVNEDAKNLGLENYFFGEDQARYVITINKEALRNIGDLAEIQKIHLEEIGFVIKDKIKIETSEVALSNLIKLNESLFPEKFS